MRDTTAQKLDRVIVLVEGGATIRAAAEACGLGETTVFRIAAENREIRERLKKARDQRDQILEEEAINAIRSSFTKHWQSASWYLERRWPSRYGLRPNYRQPERDAPPPSPDPTINPVSREFYRRWLEAQLAQVEALEADGAGEVLALPNRQIPDRVQARAITEAQRPEG